MPKILLKGPCDLDSIAPLLESVGKVNLETNFTNEQGILIISQSHSVHILESQNLTKEELMIMSQGFPFIDEKSFETKIFSDDYKIIFLSTLVDARFNIYRHIATNNRVALIWNNLTDVKIWDKFVSGEYSAYNVKFTYEMLRRFNENYVYEGLLKPEEIVSNYKKIRSLLPDKTLLVLLLGSENYYDDSKDSVYRATNHKKINPLLKKAFANYDNVKLIDYTDYIHSRNDYTYAIDNPQRRVRFEIAADMVKLANEYLQSHGWDTKITVKPKSGIKILLWSAKPINYKIYDLIKQAEDKDVINIIGYAIFENNNVVFYEKLGGKIIAPPHFQIVVVADENNFYEHLKILQFFKVPNNLIVDGRVFQIPNLNFQKFLIERVAYGSVAENEFSDESRMIYQRVCIVGGAVAVILGRGSYVKKISFFREKILGEVRIGNYTTISDNVKIHLRAENITNISNYDWQNIFSNKVAKIIIGSDVKINSGAVLISNDIDNPLVIGDGAIVEENSVVTKSVPPYAVVGGNPAQIINYRFPQEIIDALQKIKWWDWDFDKIKKYFPYFTNIKKFISAYNAGG